MIGAEAEAVVWITLTLLYLRTASGMGILDGMVVASWAVPLGFAHRVCLWFGIAWLENHRKRFTLLQVRYATFWRIRIPGKAWCSFLQLRDWPSKGKREESKRK